MAGRILTLQRQVRELGRLRAGFTAENAQGRKFPRASKTWILTSPNRAYIEAAAALWGGQVEQWQPQGKGAQEWRVITERPAIDAILPPGDPINQAYEMWTGGGCQRRCDGETEGRSGQLCLCRAQFGDDFHTVPVLDASKKAQRCSMVTRLSVFLPDLPDIGVWRVETHGYWPSVHITGYVETIKGLVGEQVMVPVVLGIEPRTKVRDGQTSQYVEIVVALKERASFGQIISAPASLAIGGPSDTRTIEAGEQRAAIGSASQPEPSGPALIDWPSRIRAASTLDELKQVGEQIAEDPRGRNSQALRNLWTQRRDEIKQATAQPTQPQPQPQPQRSPVQAEEDPWAGVDEPDQPATDDADLGVWITAMDSCTTVDDLRQVHTEMEADPDAKGHKVLMAYFWKRKQALDAAAKAPGTEAEVEPDRDETWTAILSAASGLGWTTPMTSKAFREHTGVDVTQATGWQMAEFRDYLKRELVPA